MKSIEREQAILENLKGELESQGYEVVLQPSKTMFPSFLAGFQPDAIAFGREKNLVIEVITQSTLARKRIDRLRQALDGQQKWDLHLTFISGANTPKSLAKSEISEIVGSISEIKSLVSQRHFKPALLVSWATLEATARLLMPAEISKPQSPLRLVESMAREGFIFPNEAQNLRKLASRRNRFIHGDLQTDVSKRDVEEMINIIERILSTLDQ